MKKLFSIIILTIFFSACNSKQQDKVVPNAIKAINEQGVSAAESKLCKSNQSLEEIQILDTQKVYYDFSSFALFGFVNGNQKCALTTDYNQNAVADGWYSVTLPDNCIANGSLWEIKTILRQDSTSTISLGEYGNSANSREIKIKSGYAVALKDLNTTVGMHFLKCVDKVTK